MTKQAWYFRNDHGMTDQCMIELTGQCMKITGGLDKPEIRVGVQKYFFGFKAGTRWIPEKYVKIEDAETHEIYECDYLNKTD